MTIKSFNITILIYLFNNFFVLAEVISGQLPPAPLVCFVHLIIFLKYHPALRSVKVVFGIGVLK